MSKCGCMTRVYIPVGDKCNWCLEADALRARVAELEQELAEQARLNGKGGSRELALMTQVRELEAERDRYKAALEKIVEPPIYSRAWVHIAESQKDYAREALAQSTDDNSILKVEVDPTLGPDDWYFKGAVCRGSKELGTACGRCERCRLERSSSERGEKS